MALTIKNEHFYDTVKDKVIDVHAKQTRAGRWQYRAGRGGKVIASGMAPAEFARSFWYRDDFQEALDNAHTAD